MAEKPHGIRRKLNHMALVAMAMLFMTEERELHREKIPLLSCDDIETLLRTFLPRRDIDSGEIVRQLGKAPSKATGIN